MKGLFIFKYLHKQTAATGSLMSGMNVDKIKFLNIQNEKIVQVVFGQKVDGLGFALGFVLFGTHKVQKPTPYLTTYQHHLKERITYYYLDKANSPTVKGTHSQELPNRPFPAN